MKFLGIFITTLSATRIFVHFLHDCRTNRLISPSQFQKILLISGVWIMFSVNFATDSGFFSVLLSFSGLIPIFFWLKALTARRKHEFRTALSQVIEATSLKIRVGTAFRPALLAAITEIPVYQQPVFRQMVDSVTVESQRGLPREIVEATDVFARALKDPRVGLSLLETLRYKMAVEDRFLQRSRAALAQIRAQNIIACILYLALLVFVGLRFGWRANPALIIFASALFMVGVAWVMAVGRRIKWTV